MNETKPIKRSPQLQPLSREHHDGLLFAWKIRQGLDNKTSIDKLRNFIWWFWVNHMRQHISHEEIKELIIDIDREVDLFDIKELAKKIEIHIRWEERSFFQYFEDTLSPEDLNQIHAELDSTPIVYSEEWKDEFWVVK